MAQKPETKFRVNIVKPFLKTLKNSFAFPIQQLAILGDPDFIICARGVFIALELKSEDPDPRRLQQYKLDEVKRCGGTSLVATPKNWHEIKLILIQLDRGLKPGGIYENG